MFSVGRPRSAGGKERHQGDAMSKTIVLAVDVARHDPARHVTAAVEMTRELAHDTGDRVIVLHVHEFAVGRFGRMQVDCNEGAGERLVAQIVSDLKNAGIDADSTIREADYGHVARKILAVADEYDPRLIVLGASSRTDVPLLPFGSVSHRLLHISGRPVLIVPRRTDAARTSETADAAAVTN
jgi:nucleotide-binding universal stress UspA family protein